MRGVRVPCVLQLSVIVHVPHNLANRHKAAQHRFLRPNITPVPYVADEAAQRPLLLSGRAASGAPSAHALLRADAKLHLRTDAALPSAVRPSAFPPHSVNLGTQMKHSHVA